MRTEWRQPHGGVPRKYYALSPAGREALAGFLHLWPRFVGEIGAILDSATAIPEGVIGDGADL